MLVFSLTTRSWQLANSNLYGYQTYFYDQCKRYIEIFCGFFLLNQLPSLFHKYNPLDTMLTVPNTMNTNPKRKLKNSFKHLNAAGNRLNEGTVS